MREMKDSGIAWVGDVPSNWDVHPLYYFFQEHKHKNALGTEQNLLSLSYGKIIRKDINTTEGLLPENFNTYNIIEENDIVLVLGKGNETYEKLKDKVIYFNDIEESKKWLLERVQRESILE